MKSKQDTRSNLKEDPFIESIKNPANLTSEKLKKIDLEEIEDEMWLE